MTIHAIRIQCPNSEHTVLFLVDKLVNPSEYTGLVVTARDSQELLKLMGADRACLWIIVGSPELEVSLLPWPNDNERAVIDEAYRVYSYGSERVILECIRHWDFYSSDAVNMYDNFKEAIEEYVEK